MFTRVLITAVTLACIASAQAINAASYRAPGMPGYGVARGSMFTIFGSGLGPNTLVMAPSLPLTANLGGTTIQVSVGSTAVAALMYYTSSSQVAAVLPSNTPTGNGNVTISYNGRSATTTIRVVDSAFGIFTRMQSGFGPGIVQNWVDSSTAPTNALNASLQPGQTAVLWGTGIGPISGSDADLPPVANLASDAVVLIGGKTVTPDYAGRTGSYPGIDQVNFKVPDGVSGCYVPVAIKAGGVVSNYVSVSIADNGGSCSDYTSYAAKDIDTAAANNQSRIGQISATSVVQYDFQAGSFTNSSEGAFAEFRQRPFTQFLAARGPTQPVPAPAPGSCTATTFRVNASDTTTITPIDPVNVQWLNAGQVVAVKGVSLTLGSDKTYTGSLPNGTLTPGALTAQGGRQGADVSYFQTTITLPQTISWTNAGDIAAVALSLSKALQVKWSGGDAANEYVVLRGMSTTPDGTVRGSFVCTESVSAGTLTVPVDVLSALPASAPTGPNFVEIGTATRLDTSRFDVQGLDGAYFQVRRLQRIPMVFQ